MHARYGKDITNDLHFKTAPPVVGGREFMQENGKLEEGAKESSFNNFQGRYIIRHYWDKPVACKEPHYDQWGGAPGDPNARPKPTAAKGLATAPRGKVALRAEVQSPVPLLGIPGKPPHRRAASK